jgi:iron-sulfur cluster assembly accessory protein
MVTITERAAAKVKELLEAEADPALTALRVAVEGGGCSGFQYALGFDAGPEEGDAVAELHGVRIVVDPYSLPYVDGADVDYVDGLVDAGFRISNPNVEAACGCGSSFQAKSTG